MPKKNNEHEIGISLCPSNTDDATESIEGDEDLDKNNLVDEKNMEYKKTVKTTLSLF